MRQGPYKSYLPLLTPGDSMETDTQPLRHSLANSPVKGRVVNILDFVSHSLSVANAQVCMKYVNNVNNDEHGCVPIKLCGL